MRDWRTEVDRSIRTRSRRSNRVCTIWNIFLLITNVGRNSQNWEMIWNIFLLITNIEKELTKRNEMKYFSLIIKNIEQELRTKWNETLFFLLKI